MFAGKMNALVYGVWKNRIKGRDCYDFEWYIRHNVPLDFRIFTARTSIQSGGHNEIVFPEKNSQSV